LTPKRKYKVQQAVEQRVFVDLRTRLGVPYFFVLGPEGGFMEPGKESVDVFEVDV
jgi:hypothetical protein